MSENISKTSLFNPPTKPLEQPSRDQPSTLKPSDKKEVNNSSNNEASTPNKDDSPLFSFMKSSSPDPTPTNEGETKDKDEGESKSVFSLFKSSPDSPVKEDASTEKDKGSLHLFDDPKFRPDPVSWLNYLDEERTGKVDSSAVIEFWNDLGIPDGKNILKELKLKPEGQVDVPQLTKALEEELKKQSPTYPRLHQVAVVSLLHSADKLWKDNEEVVEECGKMTEEMEILKQNLKEADELLGVYEDEKEQDMKLLQEENAQLKQQLHPQLQLPQQNELEVTKVKLDEENEQLKATNSSLQAEIKKLQAASQNTQPTLEAPESKAPLSKQDEYSSFDFDDTDSAEEIRRKVRKELERRESLVNKERKAMEGSMMVEISEVEKKYELLSQEMKDLHEKNIADLKTSHGREIENKMAEKEKQLMMDIVTDKIKKKGTNDDSEDVVKIRQLEKELDLRNKQLTEVSEDLEKEKNEVINLNTQLRNISTFDIPAKKPLNPQENKDSRVFEEYMPSSIEDDGGVEYEEKIKKMENNYEDKIGKLKKEYEELSKKWDGEGSLKEEEVEKVRVECEEEMVKLKKKCDAEVMEGVNKLNELDGRLTEVKNQLALKEAAIEKLKSASKENEEKLSEEVSERNLMIDGLKEKLKEREMEVEAVKERLEQRGREYDEVVGGLERDLKRVEEDGRSQTSRRLDELDEEVSGRNDEILKLKKKISDIERDKLTALTESKRLEDDYKKMVSNLKKSHEDEMGLVQRQLKLQQQPFEQPLQALDSQTCGTKDLPMDNITNPSISQLTASSKELSDTLKKAEKEKDELMKEHLNEKDKLKTTHEMAMSALKRDKDKKEIDKEIESQRKTSEILEDMRRRHEKKLNDVSLSNNKQLNQNLKEFSDQVAELKRSFVKMDKVKDAEMNEMREEKEGLVAEVDDLKDQLQKANNKPSPETIMIDRTDILSERDLLKGQLRQTLNQLNDVTTALTLLTNQHRADKQAWKQLGDKTVDVDKHKDVLNKLAQTESSKQRLQNMLERNQSEAAKMLIATRETFDKELQHASKHATTNAEQLDKLHNIISDKNNIIKSFEKQQERSDVLSKDLYGENARLLNFLQGVEKQRNEANAKVSSLEQKVLYLGELIRDIFPAAVS